MGVGTALSATRGRLSRVIADDGLFYIAFALYFVLEGLARTTLSSAGGAVADAMQSAVQLVVIGLLAFRVFRRRQKLTRWLMAVLVLAVCFISWRTSGVAWLFWLAIFVVFGDGASIKKTAKVAFACSLGLLLMATTCSLTGLIPNEVFVRNGVTRYGMGFLNPNSFGLYFMALCASFSVIRFGRKPIPDIILLALSAAVVLFWSDSRSSVLLMAVQAVSVLVFYAAKTEKSRRPLRILLAVVVTLVVLLSMYFMVFFNPTRGIDALVDRTLSGRVSFANGYFKLCPFTLFGNDYTSYPPIYWENGVSQPFVVDNAFCHLYLHFGVVPFALFIVAFFVTLGRFVKQKAWSAELFLFALMAIYGFVETPGLQIDINYSLLLFSLLLSQILTFRRYKPKHMKSGVGEEGLSQEGLGSGQETECTAPPSFAPVVMSRQSRWFSQSCRIAVNYYNLVKLS